MKLLQNYYMNLGTLTLEKDQVIRKCVAILGIRGSGKSNTAKVFAEELIKEKIPLVIVDPDGEYRELDAVVFDRFNVDPEEVVNILIVGKSVVLDVNDWNDDVFKFLTAFFNVLWETSKVYRKDLFVLLEEAHEFIPQGGRTPLSDVLVRIALRGRKRGIGMILVSQRSAKVNKDVLTQSEIYFLHKVVHPVDVRVYKEILPLKSREIETEIKAMETGDAIFYKDGELKKVRIRKFEELPLLLQEGEKAEI
ncbi:DNA double-strand break repair helicase HerA [Metallosphaera sp. J1]|nr:DNA double-strand break repair helicase HerA [Metallosphaera javensis (ex Hofmann et al. 2022)]